MLGSELQAVLGESNLTRQAISVAQGDLRMLTATRAEAENLVGDTPRRRERGRFSVLATAATTTDDLRHGWTRSFSVRRPPTRMQSSQIVDLEALVAALTDRLARQ